MAWGKAHSPVCQLLNTPVPLSVSQGTHSSTRTLCLTFLFVISVGLNSWQDVKYPPLEAGAIQLSHGPHGMLREQERDGGKALDAAAVLTDRQCYVCDLSWNGTHLDIYSIGTVTIVLPLISTFWYQYSHFGLWSWMSIQKFLTRQNFADFFFDFWVIVIQSETQHTINIYQILLVSYIHWSIWKSI